MNLIIEAISKKEIKEFLYEKMSFSYRTSFKYSFVAKDEQGSIVACASFGVPSSTPLRCYMFGNHNKNNILQVNILWSKVNLVDLQTEILIQAIKLLDKEIVVGFAKDVGVVFQQAAFKFCGKKDHVNRFAFCKREEIWLDLYTETYKVQTAPKWVLPTKQDERCCVTCHKIDKIVNFPRMAQYGETLYYRKDCKECFKQSDLYKNRLKKSNEKRKQPEFKVKRNASRRTAKGRAQNRKYEAQKRCKDSFYRAKRNIRGRNRVALRVKG